MKEISKKIVSVMCIILSILFFVQLPVLANTNDQLIIQKTEEDFIIYYKDICNDLFNFAYSTDPNEDKDNLIFISSVKDQLQSENVDVAYIDHSKYENYFKTDQKAYIWIKDINDNYLVEADEVDLTKNVLTEDQIDFVKNTTKRISGNEENSAITNEWTDENDVKHTVILSQYVIDMEDDTNYYYQLTKIPKGDTTSDAAKLYDLAKKLEETTTDKYQQLKNQFDFYDLYLQLEPEEDSTGWVQTTDGIIVEPEDTITGDKYIIWLKADNNGEITQDAKFLICEQFEKEDKIKFTPLEVIKLPKTYDSIALVITFAVVLALIALVIVLKNKFTNNNTDDE